MLCSTGAVLHPFCYIHVQLLHIDDDISFVSKTKCKNHISSDMEDMEMVRRLELKQEKFRTILQMYKKKVIVIVLYCIKRSDVIHFHCVMGLNHSNITHICTVKYLFYL